MLSRAEVRMVLGELRGTMWLIVTLLYGAGLRLLECLELRVNDFDFDRRQIVVRQGKGRKDRVVPLRTVQELLGHADVSTAMIYTHVLERGALGVRSPADRL